MDGPSKLGIDAGDSRPDFSRDWDSTFVGFTFLLSGIELADLGIRDVTVRSSDGVLYVRISIRKSNTGREVWGVREFKQRQSIPFPICQNGKLDGNFRMEAPCGQIAWW